MNLTVDASVVAKWFSLEADHDQALRVLEARPTVIAPEFVVFETLNVIWKQFRRNELTHPQAIEIESRLWSYFDKLVPALELSQRTLALSIELDHPIYDCAYLACALAEGGPLVSADIAFIEKAERAGYSISLIRLDQFASHIPFS